MIPGYETRWEEDLRAHARRVGDSERVRFLGWISDGELEGLYEAAICLAFPSLAEGFGLPVLEAMMRGLPVACSDAASLPEVAGEAALYFDPLDTGAMAEAISDPARATQIFASGSLRPGRERAAGFTWPRAAAETVACYERALAT